MSEQNIHLPVMAKIEKWEAIKELDSIVETFDALMVARGDLGVEIPETQVPQIQKKNKAFMFQSEFANQIKFSEFSLHIINSIINKYLIIFLKITTYQKRI